ERVAQRGNRRRPTPDREAADQQAVARREPPLSRPDTAADEQPTFVARAEPGTFRGSESDAEAPLRPVGALALAAPDVDPALRAARLYFSIDPMGQKLGAIEPWAPGEEPQFQGER